jgi:hypothetical protein
VDTLSKELDFQPDILSAAPEKDLAKRQKKPAKAKSEPAKDRPAASAAAQPAAQPGGENTADKAKKAKKEQHGH